jgi:hypothetical protein
MPTTEEAMSLMEPFAPGSVHIDAAFQRGINFIRLFFQLGKYFIDQCCFFRHKIFLYLHFDIRPKLVILVSGGVFT